MKKIITLLLLLFTLNISAQTYPIIENFNTLNGWTVTNGAGIQNNGGGNYCLSTNIGTTPYPNSSTITAISPVASYTNCLSNLRVSFPLSGIIEPNFDYLYFDYFNGVTWINLGTYTGSQSTTYNYPIPNTTRQFRFRLVTDCSVNGYKNFSDCSLSTSYCYPPNGNCSGSVNVYYYDICSLTITCSTVLPIELLYFKGNNITTGNLIEWESATEINCSYYQLERSPDAVNWTSIATLNGAGTSTQNNKYNFLDVNITPNIYYYKLTQFDFSGLSESFNIISIDVKGSDNKTIKSIKCYNFLGQEVICNSPGIYLEITEYSNGERLVKQRIQD